MYLTSPLALAATAAAFVIVPKVSESDDALFRALPIADDTYTHATLAGPHVVDVPCEQCGGVDGNVYLNLSVADDNTKLLLNGAELYPHADAQGGPLVALMGADGEMAEKKLGYTLAVLPAPMDKQTGLQLLDVELRVIEVDDQFVTGVPAVNVRLLRAPATEEIAISSVHVALSKVSACTSLVCHAREVMTDVLKALRASRTFRNCHGRLRHGKNSALLHENIWNRPEAHDASEEQKQQPHPHPHRHFGHNEWRRLLTQIAAHIFLPVLMGITAGVGVALFAMALCSLFVRLAASVRGSHTESCAVRSSDTVAYEEDFACEKARLMEATEMTPKYEDRKI